jgi:zinc protease
MVMAQFDRLASIVGWMLAALLLWAVPINANAMEEKLKHFTLPNGLDVFIKEDHARKVAAIQLWVMVGSADEERSELGISHVIEHMAFKGTERRGVGQIAAEVEALGGEIKAYTRWDETVFHITVPQRNVPGPGYSYRCRIETSHRPEGTRQRKTGSS